MWKFIIVLSVFLLLCLCTGLEENLYEFTPETLTASYVKDVEVLGIQRLTKHGALEGPWIE